MTAPREDLSFALTRPGSPPKNFQGLRFHSGPKVDGLDSER